jgi:hypothetical protein
METRIVCVLSVVILAVVFMAAKNQPSGAQERKNEQQANPAVPVYVNCNCAAQADDSKNKPQGWHKFVTWPEGIIAWAIIATLGAIVWQSWEMRRQNRNMVAKERARITINPSVHPLDLDEGPEWIEALKVVWTGTKITVANLGGTKAFNIQGRAEIIGTPSTGTLGSEETSVLDIPTVLEPNTDPITLDVVTLLKGIDHASAVESGREIIHVAGWVIYEDIFGNHYKSSFRYIWKVDIRTLDDGDIFHASHWERTAEGNRAT